MTWSHQYSVEIDDHQNGFVYHTFREIYLINDSIPLIYSIDTNIINKINTDKSFAEICNQTLVVQNKKPIFLRISKLKDNLIELKLNSIEKIGTLYNQTMLTKSKVFCTNIRETMSDFNLTMQRIKFFNASNILNLIPIEKWTSDVKNMASQLINPSFQIDNSFPKSFFANAKYIFAQTNDKVQIGFNIPTYEKITLFQMHSKPFLFKQKPFIYDIDTLYISKTPRLTILTKAMYKGSCFWSAK